MSNENTPSQPYSILMNRGNLIITGPVKEVRPVEPYSGFSSIRLVDLSDGTTVIVTTPGPVYEIGPRLRPDGIKTLKFKDLVYDPTIDVDRVDLMVISANAYFDSFTSPQQKTADVATTGNKRIKDLQVGEVVSFKPGNSGSEVEIRLVQRSSSY